MNKEQAIENYHHATLDVEEGNAYWKFTCTAPVGAWCRSACPTCDDWCDHDRVDIGECNALLWLENDDAMPECQIGKLRAWEGDVELKWNYDHECYEFVPLPALPDETPTVLTREKLDELIAQTEPERCANCEYAGMREASAAMDGLRDYPTVQPLCDYHEGVGRLRDALLALGPVVVEGPVECGYDNIAEGVTSERVHAVMALQGRKYCSDCGARLSKGNNDES